MFHPVLLFLNIGGSEMILIVFVALLLFGGEKLPGMARTLGKGIRDFKDASEGVKREINNQINSYEEKKHDEPEAPVSNAPEETQSIANTLPAAQEHTATDSYIEEHHTEAGNPADGTYKHNTPVETSVSATAEHASPVHAEHAETSAVKAEEPVKTTHE
jgi:TatA/E family protein of Tat protein translocase